MQEADRESGSLRSFLSARGESYLLHIKTALFCQKSLLIWPDITNSTRLSIVLKKTFVLKIWSRVKKIEKILFFSYCYSVVLPLVEKIVVYDFIEPCE